METYRTLGALDVLELVVLPVVFGDGVRLTEPFSPDAGLTFERERALPGVSVEIVYSFDRARAGPAGARGRLGARLAAT
jgi:hypothetical protein